MPRPLRCEIYSPSEVSILHVCQRCVRRAFLSDVGDFSGKDYFYRKEWKRVDSTTNRKTCLRLRRRCFVLSDSLQSPALFLRNRPDVAETWWDKQVALRWLQIFPGKRIEDQLGDPTTADVDALAKDPERLALVRKRLSDISWFMRALSEPIARMANRDDDCTGSFG